MPVGAAVPGAVGAQVDSFGLLCAWNVRGAACSRAYLRGSAWLGWAELGQDPAPQLEAESWDNTVSVRYWMMNDDSGCEQVKAFA